MTYRASDTRYDSMEYRHTGRSGRRLPVISLGLWQNFGGTRDYPSAFEILSHAFDHGITHFDLANNYGPPPGAAEELFGALQMVRMMAAPLMDWWPAFGDVWSDAALRGISAGGAAVMQRHGWTLGDAWGQFGPYIALVGAVLPPSLVTWQAIQQRREEARRPPARRVQPEEAEGVRP